MHHSKIILPLAVPGLPGPLQLGRYNQSVAHAGLEDHRHEGAMEICLLLRGRQTYVVKGRAYELKGGDVFVTFPGEVHSTGRRPQERGAVLADPRRPERGGALPCPGGAELALALRRLPRRHFPGGPQLRVHCDAIMRLQQAGDHPLRAAATWHEVQGFLLGVVEAAQFGVSARNSNSLEPVLRHIEGNLDRALSLKELAGRAGLSLPRFKARFKAEQGVPPGEYVLRARIAQAQRLLRGTNWPITRIAHELGFPSSQYFATVVKRYTRLTPWVSGRGPSSLDKASPRPRTPQALRYRLPAPTFDSAHPHVRLQPPSDPARDPGQAQTARRPRAAAPAECLAGDGPP
jgi:AraC-like DNA-binding protein